MVKSTGFPFGYGNLSYKIKPFDLLIIVYVLRSQADLKLYLIVETLRHRKRVEAALLGTSKYSFAMISPWYLDSIKIWRHPLLAIFPANSAVF